MIVHGSRRGIGIAGFRGVKDAGSGCSCFETLALLSKHAQPSDAREDSPEMRQLRRALGSSRRMLGQSGMPPQTTA